MPASFVPPAMETPSRSPPRAAARSRPTREGLFKVRLCLPGKACPQVYLCRVVEKEEALIVYESVPRSADCLLRHEIRMHLLLASASLAPGDSSTVVVTLPTEEELQCLRGMQISQCQQHSRFQWPPVLPGGLKTLSLECDSPAEARRLVDRLSAAGCSLRNCLTSRYKFIKELGKGGFGNVYLAQDTWKNNREVAIKVFVRTGTSASLHPLRESTLLRWSKGPLFPKFKSMCPLAKSEMDELNLGLNLGLSLEDDFTGYAMVTEYVRGVELFEIAGALPKHFARSVMRQLLAGLAELHRSGVVHRDVKPENLLISITGDDVTVKLVDFGLACLEWDSNATQLRAGSLGFLAPEVLMRPIQRQTTKVDCFGAGAVLYWCLCGTGPFQASSTREMQQRNLANQVRVDGLRSMPSVAGHLLANLMRTQPDMRLLAEDALRHPFLAEPEDSESDTDSDSGRMLNQACASAELDSDAPMEVDRPTVSVDTVGVQAGLSPTALGSGALAVKASRPDGSRPEERPERQDAAEAAPDAAISGTGAFAVKALRSVSTRSGARASSSRTIRPRGEAVARQVEPLSLPAALPACEPSQSEPLRSLSTRFSIVGRLLSKGRRGRSTFQPVVPPILSN